MRRVDKYALDGTFVETYASVAEAARSVDGGVGNILKCCQEAEAVANGTLEKPKHKSAYKFKWRFADDMNSEPADTTDEEWRQFSDTILLSSHGRVRRKVGTRWETQSTEPEKNGQQRLWTGQANISLNRAIYKLFVDDSLQDTQHVLAIDGDPSNARADNLTTTPSVARAARALPKKADRKQGPECRGDNAKPTIKKRKLENTTPESQKPARVIQRLDKQTFAVLAEYESVRAAARDTQRIIRGVQDPDDSFNSNIRNCLVSPDPRSAYGFAWQYRDPGTI